MAALYPMRRPASYTTPWDTIGRSPVREFCTPGSVRGARSNARPYRDLGAVRRSWRFSREFAGGGFGRRTIRQRHDGRAGR
jgi:hypothetical protein